LVDTGHAGVDLIWDGAQKHRDRYAIC